MTESPAPRASESGIAPPRQTRSRASFDRVRQATLELLVSKGPAGVTIAGVSELAGVSVGTIYGRVGSRANLLRAAQEEALVRLRSSAVERMSALPRGDAQDEQIRSIVSAFQDEIVQNAPTITALVALSETDQTLRSAGPEAWMEIRAAVLDALLRVATVAPLTREQGEWLFEVLYSTSFHHVEEVAAGRRDAAQTTLVQERQIETALALLDLWTERWSGS